jgi:hypothetical protein
MDQIGYFGSLAIPLMPLTIASKEILMTPLQTLAGV